MNIRLIRIAVGAVAAELVAMIALLLIIPVVMLTNPPSTFAAEPLVQRLADWVGPIGGFLSCALAAWWVTRKLDTGHMMNGLIVGVAAAVLYVAFLIVLGAPFRLLLLLVGLAGVISTLGAAHPYSDQTGGLVPFNRIMFPGSEAIRNPARRFAWFRDRRSCSLGSMNFRSPAGRCWLVVFVLVLAPVAHAQTAQELYSRASAKQERGDYRGAIEDFDRVLKLLPDSASAYTSRGNAKEGMGDYEGAIADHSRGIELAPTLPHAYNNRGYAKQKKGDLAGAISDYEHSLELDPEYAFAINNRTLVLREVLSILDEAIKADDLAQVEATVAAIPSAATAADALGWTGLHYLTMHSAGENTLAIGEFLLESGANPNARDAEGNAPLHFAGQRISRTVDDAAYHGLIALLLAQEASVFERNGIGLTPLHQWVIFDASAKAVEMLLDREAPISDKATRDGWTPLHGAAVSGRTDLVELLLRRGATGDKLVKDSAGRTPREAALLAGQTETAELLQ